MKSKLLVAAFLLITACSLTMAQPPNDLSGIAFIVDPGHSQNENVGIYGYSEANKALDVAFHLREFLRSSNADTVHLTRTDRTTNVTITQRYTVANSFPHPTRWFQSIHSDAASIGSSANSILLLIGDNCAASSGKICQSRWGQTTISMGNWQSDLMARTYRISTRGVYGDRTFGLQFNTPYGSSGVGVLRETAMPATLSEGGFHTNSRQNLLNMNNESKRSEAKAIWMAMLGHYGVTRPPIRTLVGVITDQESGKAVNGVTVSTDGKTYRTNSYYDTFKQSTITDTTLGNGYYYFEDLPVAPQIVTVTAPGYDTLLFQVTVVDSFFTFRDVQIFSSAPPRVVSSTPANNAVNVHPANSLALNFSRAVDPASTSGNIYLLDPLEARVNGTGTFSNGNKTYSFKPSANLKFDSTYKFVIRSQVRDLSGHFFDGNGDGIAGDSLIITFKTGSPDTIPPFLVSSFPQNNAIVATPNHVITLLFNEELDDISVNTTWFQLEEIGGAILVRQVQHWKAGGRSGVNVIPTAGFQPGRSYMLTIYPDVRDLSGNKLGSYVERRFTVLPSSFQYTVIDDFNSGISNWFQPLTSGSTTGVDSASFSSDGSVTAPNLASNSGSARLNFSWATNASNWLLRQYLNGGAPRSVLWTKQATRLQVYVHGDGSGTPFRFAVDDSVDAFPSGTAANHEVSEWIPINWIGWRLVEWDLENDPIGSWLGNQKLEGTLRFDSFQLQYVPGTSKTSGQIYFDQLQLAKGSVTLAERISEAVPAGFQLFQNYPNPFNPETRIEYTLASEGPVHLSVIDLLGHTVRTLVSEQQLPGRYAVVWDGRDESGRHLASGMYLYRLYSAGTLLTKKMTLLK